MSRTPALTLWRPWVACITDLPETYAKRVENRGWVTGYRGDVWLHAGKKFDDEAVYLARENGGGNLISPDPALHPVGVVALVELVGVCTKMFGEFDFFGSPCDCGPWSFPGEAHWQIANVRKLAEPVPCRGAQQLWMLPADVEAACRAQLEAVAR